MTRRLRHSPGNESQTPLVPVDVHAHAGAGKPRGVSAPDCSSHRSESRLVLDTTAAHTETWEGVGVEQVGTRGVALFALGHLLDRGDEGQGDGARNEEESLRSVGGSFLEHPTMDPDMAPSRRRYWRAATVQSRPQLPLWVRIR